MIDISSAYQASDYENTAEFIINHIRKTFDKGNDILKVMWAMTAMHDCHGSNNMGKQMSMDTDVNNDARETRNSRWRTRPIRMSSYKGKECKTTTRSKSLPVMEKICEDNAKQNSCIS